MSLVPLQSFNLLRRLRTIVIHALLLLSHPLCILGFELRDHLGVRCLRVGFVIEVHFLLEFEGLLELFLKLLQIRLTLITL